MGGVYAVEDQSHVVETLLLIDALYVGELTTVELAGTDNEDGEVCHTVGNGCIGDDAHRHTIGHYIVITLAKLLYQLIQTGVQEEFGRVGRNGSCRDDVQSLHVGHMTYDIVHLHLLIGQIVGESHAVMLIVMRECSLADVHVEHHHTLLGKDEREGQVARDEGLAGTLVEGGEGDDLHAMVSALHEVHVGAHDAEGLRDDIVAIGSHQLSLSLTLLA